MATDLENALHEAGWEDIHVISRKEGARALEYQDLIDQLEPGQQWNPIRRIASDVQRTPSRVEDELRELAAMDIVELSRAGVRLKHRHILIEQLV